MRRAKAQAADAILLTVFLRHDQSKTLDEITKSRKALRTEFYPSYDYYPVVRDKLASKARLAL
jgi:hypothetical protein